MDILIVILLIIAGILLFMVEVFVTPGISIAGISAAICLLYANYYAFANMGSIAGFITLIISAAGCITILIWFVRSKTLEKLALKKEIKSNTANKAAQNIQTGDLGISVTRLALIGNAEINGNIVEVRSADGLLNEKTPIIVERIDEGTIIVKKQL